MENNRYETYYGDLDRYREWRKTHEIENVPLYIGRFQPFHLGHVKCLRKIREKYSVIIIGIGSAQHSLTVKNPLPFETRKEIIVESMRDYGASYLTDLDFDDIYIMPIFDMGDDRLWIDTIIHELGPNISIYSNNDWVRDVAYSRGIEIEEKMERYSNDNLRASAIRDMIKNFDDNWYQCVPAMCHMILDGKKWTDLIRNSMKDIDDSFAPVEPKPFKIGIDIHGVVDKYPHVFVNLAKGVRKGGGEVHILTGSPYTEAFERELLSYNEGEKWWDAMFSITDHLVSKDIPYKVDSIGGKMFPDADWDAAKSEYCQIHGISVHVDDSEVFLKYFKTPYLLFKQ